MLSLVLTAALTMAGNAQPFAQSASVAATSEPTPAKELNLRAYVELLRRDIGTQKVAILTELMGFTESEDKVFWPVYRAYELELGTLNDERVTLIEEYARNYTQISDALADSLVTKALDLEARRTALKAKYYDRFKSVLSPKTAARVVQIEHQLLLLIDLQIASLLPAAR